MIGTQATPPVAVGPWRALSFMLSSAVRNRWRDEGLAKSLRTTLSIARSAPYWRAVARLLGNPVFARYVAPGAVHDPLFAVRNRSYLARGLTLRQRIAMATLHFDCEGARCGGDYHARVYGSAGLTLWRMQVEDRCYEIVLRDAGGLRHEGPLAVALRSAGVELHITLLGWACADALAGRTGLSAPVLFLACNHSLKLESQQMKAFQADFPHNAPAYFCMAAVMGLARAHGLSEVAGVDGERQIAYRAKLASGFRRSYADFWRSFGGEPAGALGHLIPVPARLPPLETLAQKHRTRAKARRRWWAEIGDSALRSLEPCLVPAPKGVSADPAASAGRTAPPSPAPRRCCAPPPPPRVRWPTGSPPGEAGPVG